MSVVASAGGNSLYVYGDDAANGIHVARSNLNILVSKRNADNSYTPIYTVADSKIDNIVIDARKGDDHVEVDYAVLANVTIYGGGGADWIKTGGLECSAYGDYKTYSGSQADDNAADTLISNSQNVAQLWGEGGNDKLYSNSTTDPIYGTDYLYGGSGNDKFYATSGHWGRQINVLGHSGSDTLYTRPDRHLNFHGGTGTDTVDFSSASEAVLIHTDGTKHSGSRFTVASRNLFFDSDIENAVGSKYGDEIYMEITTNASVNGGDGDDFIWTGSGNDVVNGGNGNDTVNAHEGNDSVYGDAGNDSLNGGVGSDLLQGGDGNDRFWDKDGSKDSVYGGAGTDSIAALDSFDFKYSVP